MAIGIEFLLKANTAAFTQGLARIENATGKLQKGLMNKFEGRDLARGLTTALGLSVDKIADKFARLWTGVTEDAEKAFERMVQLSNELTDLTIKTGTDRLTDEQKLKKELIDQGRIEKRLAENKGKTQDEINERYELTKKLILSQNEAKKIQNALDEKASKNSSSRSEIRDQVTGLRDADAKADYEFKKDQNEKYNRAEDALLKKFAPSVEQLAGMSAGGFAAVDDPRLIAKQILQKEGFAAQAAARGDITSAVDLGREARTMRESLQFVTGSGEALTSATAEKAFASALTVTNEKLDLLTDAVGGVIKATP
jgi:hypothetical protein